ncbi:MAG: hypothetical protein CMF43_02675 [Legionellales bacterium]|nr:hypothetical protein [Legionellales bacterium]
MMYLGVPETKISERIVNLFAWLTGSGPKSKNKIASDVSSGPNAKSNTGVLSTMSHYVAQCRDAFTQAVANTFFYHSTFIQLVSISKKWSLFALSFTMTIVESAVVPLMYLMTKATWRNALNTKHAQLALIGLTYVRNVTIIAVIAFLAEYIQGYFVRSVTNTIQKSANEKLANPKTLAYIRENERPIIKNAEESSMGTILSREVTDFIGRFIELHKFALGIAVFTFEGLKTIMQLGLAYEGFLVAGIMGSFVILCMRFLSSKKMIEKFQAKKASFERGVTSIVELKHQGVRLPNWVRVTTLANETAVNEAFQAENSMNWTELLTNGLTALVKQVTEPVMVITLFLSAYLLTDMALSTLQLHVANIEGLAQVIGFMVLAMPYTNQALASGQHVARILKSYFVKEDEHTVAPFDGLTTTYRDLSFEGPSELASPRVLKFMAEVKNVAENDRSLKKRYHQPVERAESGAGQSQERKPLVFAPNEMVYVLGKNGAGKSVFLNVLSGLISTEKASAESDNAGFSLYCEQKLFELPVNPPLQDEPGAESNPDKPAGIDDKPKEKPWTPAQIIAIAWPQDLGDDIDVSQGIDAEHRLKLRCSENHVDEIKMSEILERVDHYLGILYGQDSTDVCRSVASIVENRVDFANMSGGQQSKTRLAIYFAMAEKIKPRLFMIDEPYNHLDPAGKDAVRAILAEMKAAGHFEQTTVFTVTHDDNDSLHLKQYDKVMALRDRDDAIAYYGEVGEQANSYIMGAQTSSGYYQFIEENGIRANDIPAYTKFEQP